MALTLVRVKVGPWGGTGGYEWDEASYDGYDGGFTGIRSISIGSSSKYVSSMSFEYDDNGQRVMGIRRGKEKPEQIRTEELDFPGEVLTHISGCHNNNVIVSLQFRTNRNRTLGYGKMDAENEQWRRFEVSMEQAGSIVGFFGRSGDQIDAIGIYVAVWNPDRFFDGMRRQGVVTHRTSSPLHLKLREMEKRKKLEVDSTHLRERKSLLESEISRYKDKIGELQAKLDGLKNLEVKLLQDQKEQDQRLSSQRKRKEKQESIDRLERNLDVLHKQIVETLQHTQDAKRQLEQEEKELREQDQIRVSQLREKREGLSRLRDEQNKHITNLQMLPPYNKLGSSSSTSDQMHINLKMQQAQITLDIQNLQLIDMEHKEKYLQTKWGIYFGKKKSDYEKEYAMKENIRKEYRTRLQKLKEQENTIKELLDQYTDSDSDN
ncbi:uncharacterized protein LOC127770006 [Oryza glaberrima]|uniref:uncharacterized protein LOC127770006 n=1 Tax=Oryza glaberrima TaxID=4538 RepID=UPI00023E2D1B|nr:uncharacterized protein LOC127770006 [Oryza glaberrima]